MLYRNLNILREISVGFCILGLAWLVAIGPGCSEVSELLNAISSFVLGGMFTIITTITAHFLDTAKFKFSILSLLSQLGVALILSGVGHILFSDASHCNLNPSHTGLYIVLAGMVILFPATYLTNKN